MTKRSKGGKPAVNPPSPSKSQARPPSAPMRLCCFQRHFGVTCPDGLTMCCVCFERFPYDQLASDSRGQKMDVCSSCGWP